MIFLECFGDESLIEGLGIPGRRVKHSGDKSRVCRAVASNPGTTGMVDEDPKKSQPAYMAGLQVLRDEEHIRLLKDQSNGSRLIVLRPELEAWVLHAAAEAGIEMNSYNLPDSALELHHAINRKAYRNENFVRMIRDHKTKSPMLSLLLQLLTGASD